MVKRFSTVAFILAALIHLAGTLALFSEDFRLLAEFKRTGVDPDRHSIWLPAMWWIWEPVPLVIHHGCHAVSAHFGTGGLFDPCDRFHGFVLLGWSICVGVLFGFLVPRFFRWRRQTI